MYRNQKIILLHSEEEDKLPENLELGELAVNCFKDKEFICLKNTDNQIIKISPNGGGAGNSNVKQALKKDEKNNITIDDENAHITLTGNDSIAFGKYIKSDAYNSLFFVTNARNINISSNSGREIKFYLNVNVPDVASYFGDCEMYGANMKFMGKLQYVSHTGEGYSCKVTCLCDRDINEDDFDHDDEGEYTCSLVFNSTSSIYNSINIGNNNLIQSGEYNRVEGQQNYIDGNFNTIKGSDNFIDRKTRYVDVYGDDNSVSNVHNGLVSGYKIKTINNELISNICAIGNYLQVQNTNEVAFGYGNESLKDNGQGGLIKGDGTMFAVGNGVQDMNGMLFKRHNALTVKTNGEILIQESPMTDKRNNTVIPPMVSLQSLIARIKTLEEEVNRLKNK